MLQHVNRVRFGCFHGHNLKIGIFGLVNADIWKTFLQLLFQNRNAVCRSHAQDFVDFPHHLFILKRNFFCPDSGNLHFLIHPVFFQIFCHPSVIGIYIDRNIRRDFRNRFADFLSFLIFQRHTVDWLLIPVYHQSATVADHRITTAQFIPYGCHSLRHPGGYKNERDSMAVHIHDFLPGLFRNLV